MRALDLFCGAGGASMGLHRAGFEVVGVDIKPQPRYPFTFIRGDAMRPPVRLEDFGLIWASPPCQFYSMVSRNTGVADRYPDLVADVRSMLAGRTYIIENVPGAPLVNPVTLCGSMFDLGTETMQLRRHRWFECSELLMVPPCQHDGRLTIGVYGHGTNSWHREKLLAMKRGHGILVSEQREAMGIDWMTRRELSQAVPPAYSEFLASRLPAHPTKA